MSSKQAKKAKTIQATKESIQEDSDYLRAKGFLVTLERRKDVISGQDSELELCVETDEESPQVLVEMSVPTPAFAAPVLRSARQVVEFFTAGG